MVSNLSSMFARVALLIVAFVAARSTYAGDVEQNHIDAGREQFTRVRHLTTTSASATETVDRFFNARSCVECHFLGGVGGAGPNERNVQLINSPFFRDAALRAAVRSEEAETSPSFPQATTYGEVLFSEFRGVGNRFVPITADGIFVLSRRGTSADYSKQRLAILSRLAPDLPEVRAAMPVQPEPKEKTFVCLCGVGRASGPSLEERNTPPLFGLGLIATIPQAEIDAIAENQPKEIRGRAPRLRTGGIGRFGWKSQTATLADFNEGACAVELGLKTAKFTPAEGFRFRTRTPDSRREKLPVAPDVDITADDLMALTAYVAALPKPAQVVDWTTERAVRRGELAFAKAGCAICHVPDVGEVAGLYSDLLLHSVGTAGSIVYYGSEIEPPPRSFDIVRNSEIRTPPLWGVADSAPYLHDGSAATLEAAILEHTEQAAGSVSLYREKLTDVDRADLITFLKSLRAPQEATSPSRKIAAAGP